MVECSKMIAFVTFVVPTNSHRITTMRRLLILAGILILLPGISLAQEKRALEHEDSSCHKRQYNSNHKQYLELEGRKIYLQSGIVDPTICT